MLKTKPGSVEEFVKLSFILGDHTLFQTWNDELDQPLYSCEGLACSFATDYHDEFTQHIVEVILEAGFHLEGQHARS